jgi:diguanylate cyclase (GGDEF)-like protein
VARAALIAAVAVGAAAAAGAALGTAALALALPAAVAGAVLRPRAEASARRRRRPAGQDALTRLGNRALLAERIDYELLRHGRQERALAVLALDLDGVAGAARDEMLVAVADALRRTVRAQDTVARIAGAAFCVLAPETDRYAATQVAARVREAVVAAAGGPERTDLAVGVALYPHDARGAQQLLARAHAAAVHVAGAEEDAPARRAA